MGTSAQMSTRLAHFHQAMMGECFMRKRRLRWSVGKHAQHDTKRLILPGSLLHALCPHLVKLVLAQGDINGESC